MADKDADFGTVIGADASFKGDFKFGGAAKVLGNIEGSIAADGMVLVANGSKCKAQITAKEVSIEGKVEGNIEATERIEIKPSGSITGDITATKMTMADGASIDGYIRVGANNGKASAATEVKPGGASSTADSSSSSGKATATATKK